MNILPLENRKPAWPGLQEEYISSNKVLIGKHTFTRCLVWLIVRWDRKPVTGSHRKTLNRCPSLSFLCIYLFFNSLPNQMGAVFAHAYCIFCGFLWILSERAYSDLLTMCANVCFTRPETDTNRLSSETHLFILGQDHHYRIYRTGRDRKGHTTGPTFENLLNRICVYTGKWRTIWCRLVRFDRHSESHNAWVCVVLFQIFIPFYERRESLPAAPGGNIWKENLYTLVGNLHLQFVFQTTPNVDLNSQNCILIANVRPSAEQRRTRKSPNKKQTLLYRQLQKPSFPCSANPIHKPTDNSAPWFH